MANVNQASDRLIEQGIQFLIAKSSQGNWQDTKYIQHTAGAIANDLPYGAYHYWSPAYTPLQNAAGMAKIVPAAPPFGCWLDVESQAGNLTVKQSTAHVGTR